LSTDRFLGRADIADRLGRLIAGRQAGQPFLFVGPEGSGKEVTALEIARRVNCVAPERCAPRSRCESCQKAASFQHPDIRWIGPAPASLEDPRKADEVREIFVKKMANPFANPDHAASSQIIIGDPEHPGPLTVRALLQFLRRQSFQARWKVAIVADAHRLNTAAANAFLKTLEEPPPDSLIVLLTSNAASVLPTILSRCQKVPFEPYREEDLAAILAEVAPDRDPASRAEAARLADGNARKAVTLLEPIPVALRGWAESVFAGLADGRQGEAQLAAELLHAGRVKGLAEQKTDKKDKPEFADQRKRALLFCEILALLLSETVACRERGSQWRPRATAAAPLVRRAAARRDTATLLADIARVERAKHEIDGNLSIGLVMAVLLQDLSEHVRPT